MRNLEGSGGVGDDKFFNDIFGDEHVGGDCAISELRLSLARLLDRRARQYCHIVVRLLHRRMPFHNLEIQIFNVLIIFC